MKLSLLVCNLAERKFDMQKLMHDDVEVLVLTDNGEMTIGAKRQKLLCMSRGEYVAFVDDDDEITQDYFDLALPNLDGNNDYVAVSAIMRHNNEDTIIRTSKDYEYGSLPDGSLTRPPQHWGIIRRDIALKVGFEDTSYEDRAFSQQLQKLVKKEFIIPSPTYLYNWSGYKDYSIGYHHPKNHT